MSQEKTSRELLIDSIIELAGDELESTQSLIELAKDTEKDLILRLINIAEYYKNESNQ